MEQVTFALSLLAIFVDIGLVIWQLENTKHFRKIDQLLDTSKTIGNFIADKKVIVFEQEIQAMRTTLASMVESYIAVSKLLIHNGSDTLLVARSAKENLVISIESNYALLSEDIYNKLKHYANNVGELLCLSLEEIAALDNQTKDSKINALIAQCESIKNCFQNELAAVKKSIR